MCAYFIFENAFFNTCTTIEDPNQTTMGLKKTFPSVKGSLA